MGTPLLTPLAPQPSWPYEALQPPLPAGATLTNISLPIGPAGLDHISCPTPADSSPSLQMRLGIFCFLVVTAWGYQSCPLFL